MYVTFSYLFNTTYYFIVLVVLFVTHFSIIKGMEGDIFCYIHEGGKVVKSADGFVHYKGGWTESIIVSGNITHAKLVPKVCGELNIDPNSIKLEFTVKFDPSCLLPLHDEASVLKMFRFNDMFCRVYVSPCTKVGEGLNAQTRYIWP